MTPFFFDVLYVDGIALVDEPLARRVAVLDRGLAATSVPRIVTADATAAAAFVEQALAAGHEGRDGQGARRRCTRRAGAARHG